MALTALLWMDEAQQIQQQAPIAMTMSVQSLGALFLAMVMLAALPGASVATVVSQAVSGGWKAAWACTAGIILGDLLYLAVAILG